MKPLHRSLSLALLLLVAFAAPAQTGKDAQPGPDSMPQPGVPKGEVIQFTFDRSKIFPGTTRDVWVYVPAQYTPEKPACLYVNQDGIQWQAPIVFDNLIHKKEMPVTIGVFVMHGRVKAADPKAALDRFNRSYEYDGLGDNYARFLLEELLPEVEKKKTSDGRAIRLSHEGNDHAIGGSSSGAICAFTAAWERPDQFTRVFSAIGTYVGLRGGDRYPTLIRKYEPKPIRIFLQDGSSDLNIYGGDWWMANQMMERSLTFASYEVQHVWGEGGHSGAQGTAIFPDVMRWLWKDWPQPVKGGPTRNDTLNAILAPGEGWQLVGEGYRATQGPASNSKGEVFFNDYGANKTYRIGLDGKVSVFLADAKWSNGQAFGPDGRLYAAAGGPHREGLSVPSGRVMVFDAAGKATVLVQGVGAHDLVVAHNGNVYFTATETDGAGPSNVWLIRPDGKDRIVDSSLRLATGVTLSPDQSLLYVADTRTHWVYSYQIQPNGWLQNKQRYYWLHAPDPVDESGAGGMRVDRDGRLYVATHMGIQVCDQAGRVNAIIPTPTRGLTNLCFGGENFDTLFATCGDKVYRRNMKVRGAQSWDAPVRPGAPRL